jgi:hypothetical protein
MSNAVPSGRRATSALSIATIHHLTGQVLSGLRRPAFSLSWPMPLRPGSDGMDEAAIKLEMRLSAIEFLLCKIHLTMALQSGVQPQNFNRFAKEFVEGAAEQKFPVKDGALSDLFSAEWQAAIEHLIDFEREILARSFPQGSSTTDR